MKKFLTIIIILIISAIIGQNNVQDVIYLKNGTVIKGILIEFVPKSTIKIQTSDLKILIFKIEEIDKIS